MSLRAMTQEEQAQLARSNAAYGNSGFGSRNVLQGSSITGGMAGDLYGGGNLSQGLPDVGGYDNSPAAQQRRFDNMIASGRGQYANQPNSPLTPGMEYMAGGRSQEGQLLAASQGSGSSGAYGDGTGGPLRSFTTGGPLISLANNGAEAAQGSGAYTGGVLAPAGSPSGGNFLTNLWDDITGNAGSIALGGAGLLAGKEAYDRLGTIGDRAYEGANTIAEKGLEQTQFQPFTVRSSAGSQYGYNPETGEATNTLSPQEQAFQDSMFGGAQGFYDSANQPQGAREQEVFDRIRAMQAPQEERDRMALEQRLFSQGRSGVSTNQYGGTPEQLAQAQAQAEAQNQASLMAMGQAQSEQMQNANLGSNYLASAYLPQGQLTQLQLASQMFPQLQQRGQLSGAGMFGEASMGGLEALLGAGQGQANLMGMIGSGLLSGAFR